MPIYTKANQRKMPVFLINFGRLHRTCGTKYFMHVNRFNTLHTVCFMHGLSIYEIEKICHPVLFFINLILEFSAFDQIYEKMKD